MFFKVKQNSSNTVPQLLTTKSIRVNNLILTVNPNGGLEIETHGPWQGSAHEFIDILQEVLEDDGKDKQ